jgi:multiple sugar transport system permease protein
MTAAVTDDIPPLVDHAHLQRYYKRRAWARVFWVYFMLLVISVLCLGVFYTAFIASLKSDPTERPFSFVPDQISPRNWVQAGKLGEAGGGSTLFGGWRAGGEVVFDVKMGGEVAADIMPPEVSVPRDQSATRPRAAYAVDYTVISEVEEIAAGEGAQFKLFKGPNAEDVTGPWKTYRFTLTYQPGSDGKAPDIDNLPLTLTMPKTQGIVSASLPPTKIERRGRAASWDNAAPGALGYAFNNYFRVFSETRNDDTGQSLFATWIMNSFKLSFGRVLLNVFVAITAGYALARLDLGIWKRPIFFLLIFVMVVPGQVLFISNYLVLKNMGLLNTMWGAILIAAVSAGQVFVMKQFFESIPKTLEEAAYIDGASRLQVLWHVILPLSVPAVLTVVLTSFQGAWNDFFWPLIILQSPQEALALPVGLLSFRTVYGAAGDWGLILAGAFISVAPIIVMFFVFQRYFVTSDVGAGVKG